MTNQKSTTSSNPILWPGIVTVIGLLLLLSNFFLLGEINIIDLWPLVLVLIGVQILLRGDIIPSSAFRTFGITRGSIESATIEINSGEIDVSIRPLQSSNHERLIAGQFAHNSRPELNVSDVHANLTMHRQKTPWLSFSNWELGISQTLPWQIVISSYLGQIVLDLSKVIIHNALISTGIGDVHLISPTEAFEPLYIRSILGNITISSPAGYNVRITSEGGRFFATHADESRYIETQPHVYVTINSDDTLPLVDIIITGTFGSAYLI